MKWFLVLPMLFTCPGASADIAAFMADLLLTDAQKVAFVQHQLQSGLGDQGYDLMLDSVEIYPSNWAPSILKNFISSFVAAAKGKGKVIEIEFARFIVRKDQQRLEGYVYLETATIQEVGDGRMAVANAEYARKNVHMFAVRNPFNLRPAVISLVDDRFPYFRTLQGPLASSALHLTPLR
jgi:hypothetical protein